MKTISLIFNLINKKQMKHLVFIVLSLISTLASAQKQEKEDSIDYITCRNILKDIFDGKVVDKNGKIRDELVPYEYTWGGTCEGSIAPCPKFIHSYKKYLTQDLRKKLNQSQQLWITCPKDNTTFWITFTVVFEEGPRTGEIEYWSFRFGKDELGKIFISAISNQLETIGDCENAFPR